MRKDLALKRLSVYYHDNLVGLLAYLPDGSLGFQYDEKWLENGFSISPFSLPLKPEVFFAKKMDFGGLFGVFDDSLPEGWGALLLMRKLREEGINYATLNPLVKLSLVPSAGKGALCYRPNFSTEDNASLAELDALSEECSAVLKGEEIKDLDVLLVWVVPAAVRVRKFIFKTGRGNGSLNFQPPKTPLQRAKRNMRRTFWPKRRGLTSMNFAFSLP